MDCIFNMHFFNTLICVLAFRINVLSVTVLILWVAPLKMFCNWYRILNGAETNCRNACILGLIGATIVFVVCSLKARVHMNLREILRGLKKG